ncbi:hypothetical protein EV384_3449 [Micromonospora kangleipakensis]|uniref:Uncharacterized protein n=1 Tax=Micromonospora kangleipakensis TaxID=1077942 RepID=A0A4Q8BCZ6_9ACTN|nr:hypothetical protein EV384_3449 [Micromonospora kangleipakensis]
MPDGASSTILVPALASAVNWLVTAASGIKAVITAKSVGLWTVWLMVLW